MKECTRSSTFRARMRTGLANGALRHSLDIRKRFLARPFNAEHELAQFIPLLVLYAVMQDSRNIERILSDLFSDQRFSIRFDETIGLPPTVCIWNLNADGIAEFTFGAMDFRKITADSLTRWLDIVPLMDHVSRRGPFRGSVALNLCDLGVWPGLAFCDYRHLFTLIPDCTFVSTKGYLEYKQYFLQRAASWSERSNAVFWRGASTGAPVDDIADLPRMKLCMLAVQHPKRFLDFGISGIVQMNAQQAEFVKLSGLCKPFEPWQSLALYKYHVDIDGNTNSWPGLLSKLHSGGLVFKVSSPEGYRQWYYHRLQPWVHFVPVASDLSNLLPLIEYMRANDDFAARIAEQGQRFARSLTLESEMEIASEAMLAHVVSHGDIGVG